MKILLRVLSGTLLMMLILINLQSSSIVNANNRYDIPVEGIIGETDSGTPDGKDSETPDGKDSGNSGGKNPGNSGSTNSGISNSANSYIPATGDQSFEVMSYMILIFGVSFLIGFFLFKQNQKRKFNIQL